MMSQINRWFVRGWAILAIGVPAVASEPIAEEQFSRLHAMIKPKPTEESWLAIPWLTSLWEARQQAAAEGKPILLWEMDGNPLGCT